MCSAGECKKMDKFLVQLVSLSLSSLLQRSARLHDWGGGATTPTWTRRLEGAWFSHWSYLLRLIFQRSHARTKLLGIIMLKHSGASRTKLYRLHMIFKTGVEEDDLVWGGTKAWDCEQTVAIWPQRGVRNACTIQMWWTVVVVIWPILNESFRKFGGGTDNRHKILGGHMPPVPRCFLRLCKRHRLSHSRQILHSPNLSRCLRGHIDYIDVCVCSPSKRIQYLDQPWTGLEWKKKLGEKSAPST